jgi:ankyrin repeat protein
MSSCTTCYYSVRGLCVPVEEDVRRACEDTGSVEHLRSLLVAYPKLDIAGMHFNLPKREGYTPLTLAARSGHLALVRYLVV